MKVCKKCNLEKPDSAFYKHKQTKDGLRNYCKDCEKEYAKSHKDEIRAYHRQWEKNNAEKVRANQRKKYSSNPNIRKKLEEKRQKGMSHITDKKTPCAKCGETRHWVIQFHHIDPNTKSFTIGSCANRNIETLDKEIAKCVCLCSNCHDEFHYFYGKNPKEPIVALERYLEGDDVYAKTIVGDYHSFDNNTVCGYSN